MFVSLVIELETAANTTIPQTHGEAMQAEFLRQIAKLSSDWAEKLHGGTDGKTRAYTISPLRSDLASAGGGNLFLERGERLSFRLTGIGSLASEVLLAWSERPAVWGLQIGASFRAEFEIVRCHATQDRHPWAASMTVNELYESAWQAFESDRDRALLEFCTPTTFEVSSEGVPGWGNWMHLPIPRLVFASLRRRVLDCTDIKEPVFPSGSPERHVALGEFRELSSEILHFQKHGFRRAGFVGACEFLFDGKLSQPCLVWLHLLANLAFFVGIGRETTKGMGQVRRKGFGRE